LWSHHPNTKHVHKHIRETRPPNEKDTFLNDRQTLDSSVTWSFINKNKKKMFFLFLFLFLELQEIVDS
jgi:hypothetical protein